MYRPIHWTRAFAFYCCVSAVATLATSVSSPFAIGQTAEPAKAADATTSVNGGTAKFSLADYPNLEAECLAALGNKELTDALIAKLSGQTPADKTPEAIKMLVSILKGSMMGPNEGWFGPARQSYDWNWLVQRFPGDSNREISRRRFTSNPLYFTRLDRNGDGVMTADDLNWTPTSNYLKEAATAGWIFRQIDENEDGKLNMEELQLFFDAARGESTELNLDSFRRALELDSGSGGSFLPGDAPTTEKLVKGFFGSEIGSQQEGPKPGDIAPDFDLQTQDGVARIHLKDWIGEKPVVLIFGNFTCGPFRRIYPEFDELSQRYKDKAHFFGIYVREAHPADGWLMESNTRLGVNLNQPKTFEERVTVAKTCANQLKYSMPLLVDTMDDQVGNMYSGMPARAYVIDKNGKVTYQSGRGPFGFKPAEMEQSLLMTLVADEAK